MKKARGVLFCSFVSLSLASGPILTAAAADTVNTSTGTTSDASGAHSTTLLTGANLVNATDLKVGVHKTLAINFGTLSADGLFLNGDLDNAGTIYAFSTDPNTRVGHFSAFDISNRGTGLITSILPAGGIPGLTLDPATLVSGFSLSFTALNNFLNQGVINSAGSLSISAANTVTNASNAAMTAMQNINISAITSMVNAGLIATQVGNLNAATALLNNQNGILQSINGSVNLQGLLNQSLAVRNDLGQILGATGVNITTLRDNTFSSPNVSVLGGLIKGPEINIISAGGSSDIHVSQLDGAVNVKGVGTNVGVEIGDLNIASLDLTGDPTLTSVTGNVTIPWVGTSDVYSTGESLIALAGGNVTISGLPAGFSQYTIDTGSAEVKIGAGVKFTGTTIDSGHSNSGGSIQLSNVGFRTNGGAVTLVAKAGSDSGTGNIQAGNISTAGAAGAAGASGSNGGNGINGGVVTINATGTVSLGSIDTRGGAGGAGAAGLLGGGGTGGGAGKGLTFTYVTNTDKNGKTTDYTYTFSNGSVITNTSAPKSDGSPPDAVQQTVGNAVSGSGGSAYGDGNAGLSGNAGGVGKDGGSGGNGGTITLTSTGLLTVGGLTTTGGAGGAAGAGGVGGAGGNGGSGGDSYVAGNAGDGAHGGIGGVGGNGGTGGSGGTGGAVTISAPGGITVNASTYAIYTGGGMAGTGGGSGIGGKGGVGGSGGIAYGIGASGKGASGGNGGNGGNAGAGGSAGNGGGVTITGGALSPSLLSIYSSGGTGGIGGNAAIGGVGGAAGSAPGGLVGNSGGNGGFGGAGGIGGQGSAGGTGGAVSITATSLVESSTSTSNRGIYSTGGAGGAGGAGGKGGVGAKGGGSGGGIVSGGAGDAGDGGAGGAGGGGGAGGAGNTITIAVDNTLTFGGTISTSGGKGGGGGNAGSGANAGGTSSGADSFFLGGSGGSGGAGGSAGSGGAGGAGGKASTIQLTSGSNLTVSGSLLAEGGAGGLGGRSGDAGDGSNASNGGGGVVSGGGGTGGAGGAVAPGGLGGNGADGGTVIVISETGNITLTNSGTLGAISTIGGAGGGGGAGGNGGNGGNGANSGIGFAGTAGANGDTTGTNTVTVDATVGFNVSTTGSQGGSGGFGGNGGLGGTAGNGGDIRLQARNGSINITGDVLSYGNTGGLPGSPGKDGLSGQNGASHTYFGLSANLLLNTVGTNVTGGLGGAITIDGVTVGGMVFKNVKDLVTGGGSLPINGIDLWVNTGAADGSGVYGYKILFGTTAVEQHLTIGGLTVTSGVNLINAIGPILSANGITPPASLNGDFTYSSFQNNITALTPGPETGKNISTAGAGIYSLGGVITNSTYAPTGGNINAIAGSSFKTDGVMNALGGQSLHVYSVNTQNGVAFQADAHLGNGGAILIQAPTVEVTGGPSGPPTTAGTVSGGSITFITQKDNVSYLIKPLLFGQLAFPLGLGLTIGGGTGKVLATTPVKLIQNQTGSVDLADIGGTNLFTTNYAGQDLVILAAGDIVAGSKTPTGATLDLGGSSTRPALQLIMAAGDAAAGLTYGTGNNAKGDPNAAWLVLGGGTTSGGNINIPGLALGSAGTQLVYLQAHKGADRSGSIITGNVTASTGSNGAAPGTVYAFANNDILTGTLSSYSASLNSVAGNIGYPGQRLSLNVRDLSTKTTGLVFITDSASGGVTLRSSYANALYIKTTGGDLTTRGDITGGFIVLESSGSIFIKNSITGIADNSEIQLSAATSITDSTGLSLLSAPNIGLTSTAGNIDIGTLTTTKSITLYGSSNTSSVHGNQLSTPLLGLLSGSGGVTVTSTTASELLINTLGDANVTTSGAVVLGTNASLPNHAANLTVTANGNLTVNGPIAASQAVNLNTATGSNGSIILNKNIGPTNSSSAPAVTLIANGSGKITQSASLILASTLTMRSGSGDIGESAAPIYSGADSIVFATTGSVNLLNANSSQSISIGAWSGANLTLIQAGDITVTGALNASGNIRLYAAPGGSINLQNNVTAAGQVRLFAGENSDAQVGKVSTGAITLTTGKLVSAGTLILTSGSGGISGTTNDAFKTSADVITLTSTAGTGSISNQKNLSLTGNSSGSLTLVNTGTLEITGLTVTGGISASASKAITTTGKVSGSNVDLITTANDGSITLGDTLSATAATGIINLTANGSGSITQTTGSISAPVLHLTSGSGTIGTSSVAKLQTNATTLTFVTTGNVYLQNSNVNGALTITGWSGTLLDLLESGNLTVNGNLTASSSITLTSGKSGFITVNASKTVSGDIINLITPTLNDNGSITADHNLNISGNVPGNANGNAVSVVLGSGVILKSTQGSINFNSQTNKGKATVSGTGTLSSGTAGAGAINFYADANGTNVDVTEVLGKINVVGGSSKFQTSRGNLIFASDVDTSSGTASGGLIDLRANGGKVQTLNLLSSGNGSGKAAGTIYLSGKTGVTTANITASGSNTANGASVTLLSDGPISVLNVTSSGASGGVIDIRSTADSINASDITSDGSGSGNAAGTIYLSGKTGITTTKLSASGTSSANGASVTLLSEGAISTSNITASGAKGGAVSLTSTADAINTLDITTDGAGSGNAAGTIYLSGKTGITSKNLSASGTSSADGASVTLLSDGAISTSNITASGAKGGAVSLTSTADAINTLDITTDGAGSGNAAGTIYLNGKTGITSKNLSASGTSSADGASVTLLADGAISTSNITASGANGGAVSLTSATDAINTLDITTNGVGNGNAAGTIYLNGKTGITTTNLSASGSTSANGSSITLGSNNAISTADVTASGANGGAINLQSTTATIATQNLTSNGSGTGNSGGTVYLKAPLSITTANISSSGAASANGNNIEITTAGTLGIDGSISSNSTGGDAGQVKLTITGNTLFEVGTKGANFVNGSITANGVNGGRIDSSAGGGFKIATGGLIQANGTTGTGGKILIAMNPVGVGTLKVENNGKIEATNNASDSGLVGLHSGAANDVDISGSGELMAGDAVRLGNLDTTTLALSATAAGNATFSQSSVLNSFEFNAHLAKMSLISSGNLSLPKNLNLTNATGDGADFTAQANGNITFQTLISNGKGSGSLAGDIKLTSGGNIVGTVLSSNGTGGASGGVVTLKSPGLISIGTLTATADAGGRGGAIIIDPISINVGTVNVSSLSGAAGTISLIATGSISAIGLYANGPVAGTISANAGTININSASANGNSGGAINLNGYNIAIGSASATGAGGSGGLFSAQAGNLYADFINVSGGNGGNALINAGGGTTIGLVSASGSGNGGTVGITSGGAISANYIDVSGGGSGGSVVLNSGSGIYVGSINGTGGYGYGGVLFASAPIFASSGNIDLYGADGLDGYYQINAAQIFLAHPIRTSRNPKPVLAPNGFVFRPLDTSIANQLGGRSATDLTPVNKTSRDKSIEELEKYGLRQPLQGRITRKNHKPLGPGSRLAFGKIDQDTINRLTQAGIIVGPGSGGNILTLDKGNLLVCAPKNLTIRTHEGDVKIGAGSIAYVMETGNDVAVFDLYDDGLGNDVSVSTGGHKFKLTPGTQLVLTRESEAAFDKINPGTRVASRNVEKHPLADGITAYQADFSILSALQELGELKDAVSSRDGVSKRLAGKMLKTAAAISMVTNYRGAYQQSHQQVAGGGLSK